MENVHLYMKFWDVLISILQVIDTEIASVSE